MDIDHIRFLLEKLGASKVTTSANKVKSPCPLATWRHAKYKDSHPSFVVFASSTEESVCKCMACGFKGSLARLIWAIEKETQTELTEFRDLVQNHDKVDFNAITDKTAANLGIFSKRRDMPSTVTGGVPHGDFLELIDNISNRHHHEHFVNEMHERLDEESLQYLYNKRGLDHKTINKWKLGFHPGARRISIPQYDRNKKLINIGGRHLPSIDDNPFWEPPPWMHAKGFEKEHYLFGEDYITSFDGSITLVLVEGMFDAIYLDSKGIPNMIAMLGAHLSRWQIMKIRRWASKLLIVPDVDEPGYEAADRIAIGLGKQIDVQVFNTPMGKDPDELSESEIAEILMLVS